MLWAMTPSAVTMRNFRSFGGPDDVRLELRPVTLLYGRNNSGKSSLLRSIPLLADSIGHESADALNFSKRLEPLELDFDALRWKGRTDTDEHTITLGLEWDEQQKAEWVLHESAEWQRTLVEKFRFSAGSAAFAGQWKLLRGDAAVSDLTYLVGEGDGSRERVIPFRGLLPDEGQLPSELGGLHATLQAFGGSVLWLRSQRPAVRRYTSWRGAVRLEMEPTGLDAPIILSGYPELLAEVSSWYSEHIGYELVIQEEHKRSIRTMLRNRNRVSFDVDLIDTGEGVTQTLSALTALAMVRRHRQRGMPSILALEEPEDHQHPDLQRALALRICDVAADSRPVLLLETHSENILLTIRLEIIRGRLPPDDVVVYWVSRAEDGRSRVFKVVFDEDANFIGQWPRDAFQESLEIAAEIQEARAARAGHAR